MLPKAYSPSDTEDRIYQLWEETGAFHADAKSKKEPFTISMPPPNATGQLHLGHAVMLALEDIFIRHARMQGKEALWVPGTDHAAIATENVVIRLLKEQGMKDPRKELGREKLIEKIAEFVEQSRGTIRGQVRKMGSSCDWERERYTLEPALNRVVNEVFARMYKDGLIYRGHRIVNWDPKLQTTISDDEIAWKEETAPFYTFQYGPFQIGTSRPETKFGDKYVVMHPDDERYAKYKNGDTFEAEWINGLVRATVIKDTAVDPAFGTGVMTITPWHDTADFEIAERHGLEREQIIDFQGKLLPVAGEFAGMPIEKARPLVVEKLKEKGLLVKTDENYLHNKATSSRGGGTVEPQIKLQWFIDVKKEVVTWKGKIMSLKQIMHEVVHSGDITILPDRFAKQYFHWIDNLRDWCISRQIWWGHRVPVWYKADETYVGITPPEGAGWQQDTDTLDTWFSSAMWTWSTLLDPKLAVDHSVTLEELLKRSPDFQKFHPTTVMETGYDILPFWVARMILMTTYAVGQIPFETVYLHGLIRTRDGRKMSKSDPDSMIDPLDMIAKYGTDALRLSMIVGQSPGADSRLYEEKIGGYRNFVNKLWNASRFILLQCESAEIDPHDIELFDQEGLTVADQALLSALQDLVTDVTAGLAEYRLSEVGERLYSFVWDYFCDWYLELSKGEANYAVLLHALRTLLKLLHPYCPFVTEEIWTHVKPEHAKLLIQEEWPLADEAFKNKDAFDQLQVVIDIITAIRKLRTDHQVPLDSHPEVVLVVQGKQDSLVDQVEQIVRMARIGALKIGSKPPQGEVASAFLSGIEVHMLLEGLVDKDKEKANLLKEQESLVAYAQVLRGKLENKQFIERAPHQLVSAEREKLAETEEKLKKIGERLGSL